MKFASKAAVGILSCLLVVALVLALAGCGTVTSGGATSASVRSPTSSAAAASTSAFPATTVSAQKQSAEAYFTALAPALEKDYQGSKWFEQAVIEWAQTYGESSLSTSLKGWTAILPTFEQALVKEQTILKGYEAVTPPPAFREAHAALVANNRLSVAAFEKIIAAIKAKHPASELMAMTEAESSPTNAEVLAKFNVAAAAMGVALPANLVNTYADDDGSGQTTS